MWLEANHVQSVRIGLNNDVISTRKSLNFQPFDHRSAVGLSRGVSISGDVPVQIRMFELDANQQETVCRSYSSEGPPGDGAAINYAEHVLFDEPACRAVVICRSPRRLQVLDMV